MAIALVGGLGAEPVSIARPFGSHMVLPMDRPVPVWGSATAGTRVTLEFAGQKLEGKADARGQWRFDLKPMPVSQTGARMVISADAGRLILEDVLVGRVYLFSGQSNMDFPLARATGGSDEVGKAGDFPMIRLFNLTGVPTDQRVYDAATLARLNPRDHFTGNWQAATPKAAAGFSAIAWWAGKGIHGKAGIPVGLVENAVGGSGTEAWLPRETLESRPAYQVLLGDQWLDCPKIGTWARGRARQNLGTSPRGNHPFRPSFLFESGVRAFARFPFDAVIWYQGETNAELDHSDWNQQLITDLIGGWRSALDMPDLPFHLIQLPRIGGSDPLRVNWPAYRKVQADVAKRLPGVHLIVTEDLGWDSPDVHPPDKMPVAMRVADSIISR